MDIARSVSDVEYEYVEAHLGYQPNSSRNVHENKPNLVGPHVVRPELYFKTLSLRKKEKKKASC